jgi:hypothetical protein
MHHKTKTLTSPVLACLAISFAAVALADQPSSGPHVRPKEFGTEDYTVTVIPATSFTSDSPFFTYPSGYRQFNYDLSGDSGILYATVNIPSGSIIDYLGVHRWISGEGVISTDLFYVDEYSGTTSGIVNVQSTIQEEYDTDYNPTPLGWQLPKNAYNALVVTANLESQNNFATPQLGWVEIWWKRAVSPPPATPSFQDVPATHPFFPYIEALKASGITGGCWLFPPRFCPDSPLTRGQMAVFLSKALGLHWPDTPIPSLPSGTQPNGPHEFGIQDYTVTTIPATSFTVDTDNDLPSYITSYGSLARYFPIDGGGGHYWGGVSVPSGAVIDYIGLEGASTGYGELTANLVQMHHNGTFSNVASVANTPHWFDTDYNSTPLGFEVQNSRQALVLDVYQLANTSPLFGWVEIWWHRAVSLPPASASFNDVPTNHPFFQYVEALKASGITGGCQANPPLYCPDGSLTRGQMAVFLAKALGLHWPN